MKKLLYLLMVLALGLMLTSCGGAKVEEQPTEELEFTDDYVDTYEEFDDIYEEEAYFDIYEDAEEIYEGMDSEDMDKNIAVINVKDFGEIEIELMQDVAPITVANFKKLVSEGFYNGLTFHRIIKNFMIQGGDPLGDGTGDSGVKIKGEFDDNGIENTLLHRRGVVSMARAMAYDSASCQFFICDTDEDDFLDGHYAAFGKVISGMEVVDKIADEVSPKALDGNGTIDKADQPIIESITLK